VKTVSIREVETMKDAILGIIQETLQSSGLVVKISESADLIAEAEFLDAAFSFGKKLLTYRVLVSADTRDQTVYLYETLDGSNSNIASRKLKRIIHKPYDKPEVVRIQIADIGKALKAALGDEWKVKSVNSPQKVEFAKGGFALSEEPEPVTEFEIPVFKPRIEDVAEPTPIRLEKSDVNLYYMGLVVMFMLSGMILGIQSLGYIIGLAAWVIFLLLHRRFKNNLPINIGLWIACAAVLSLIVYLTMAKTN
jgi:hypothetical protein